MLKPMQQKTDKVCGCCGGYHDPEKVREVGRRYDHGKRVVYYFNCACGSTLTVREMPDVS